MRERDQGRGRGRGRGNDRAEGSGVQVLWEIQEQAFKAIGKADTLGMQYYDIGNDGR